MVAKHNPLDGFKTIWSRVVDWRSRGSFEYNSFMVWLLQVALNKGYLYGYFWVTNTASNAGYRNRELLTNTEDPSPSVLSEAPTW